MKPSVPHIKSGRHDAAALRHSKRAGRERGCWVYVPAEQLVECGLNPYEPPPDYRVYAARRPNGKPKKTLLVQLYEAGRIGRGETADAARKDARRRLRLREQTRKATG